MAARRRQTGCGARRAQHAPAGGGRDALALLHPWRHRQRPECAPLRRHADRPRVGLARAPAGAARGPLLAGGGRARARRRDGPLARRLAEGVRGLLSGAAAGRLARARGCAGSGAPGRGPRPAAHLRHQPERQAGGGADRRTHARRRAPDRSERHGLCRIPARRAAGNPLRPGWRARAASDLRRRHGAAVGGRDPRPLPPRHRHERGAARGRRADSHQSGRVQDRGALRRGDRGAHRGVGSERRALPIRRRAGGRLGAPRACGTGGAPDRPGARQLPQPRRAHRQRRRPRHAGEHGADHAGPEGSRLPGGKRASGRRGADGASDRRPHQRRRFPRQTARGHAPLCRLHTLFQRIARTRASYGRRALGRAGGGPVLPPGYGVLRAPGSAVRQRGRRDPAGARLQHRP